jgi:hypothetical protein
VENTGCDRPESLLPAVQLVGEERAVLRVDGREFQEVRPHGERSALVADQGERDEPLRGDQPLALDARVRGEPGEVRGRRRGVAVRPAADHAQTRPQDRVRLRRPPGAQRGPKHRGAARIRAQIALERITSAWQAFDQQGHGQFTDSGSASCARSPRHIRNTLWSCRK